MHAVGTKLLYALVEWAPMVSNPLYWGGLPGLLVLVWAAMWRGIGQALRTEGVRIFFAVCAGLVLWWVAIVVYAGPINEYYRKEALLTRHYQDDYDTARCEEMVYNTVKFDHNCVETKYRLMYGPMQVSIDRRNTELYEAMVKWFDDLWSPRLFAVAIAVALFFVTGNWLVDRLQRRAVARTYAHAKLMSDHTE